VAVELERPRYQDAVVVPVVVSVVRSVELPVVERLVVVVVARALPAVRYP
jgi:hypothetical protein